MACKMGHGTTRNKHKSFLTETSGVGHQQQYSQANDSYNTVDML